MASFEKGDLGFGEELKISQFYHHSPDLIRLNNGSFGACPKFVLQTQRKFRAAWLSNPDDEWHALTRNFLRAREAIASRLIGNTNCVEDLFLVDSLTVGMSLIIHSVLATMADPNSVVLVSNHTYNAVRLAINHGCSLVSSSSSISGPSIVVVDIPFPMLEGNGVQTIIDAYEKTLNKLNEEGKTVAFAFLDHIVSLPSMLIPIKEVINVCRSHGVKEIVVDGAHVPGQISLHGLCSLGCDYYLANIHKWCYAPASVAFVWVSPTAPSRNKLHHPIVSHCYNQGLFAETCMLGTKDYSAMFVVPESLDFLDALGGLDVVVNRNQALCKDAVELLSQGWQTQEYAQPMALRAPFMGTPANLEQTFICIILFLIIKFVGICH